MMIQDISPEKCTELLKRTNIGRLACVKDLQPYVVPISFAYSANSIYGFSTVGQKIDWMRANPLVCLQVDEIVSRQDWQSVVVSGRYVELSDNYPERVIAHDLLAKSASWWEPGYAATLVEGKTRPLEPIYFRISIDKLAGRQGQPQRKST
jgi:nitroimidazol reductase NimA-like FMN-containing flavoprotein (pyridoxamine 5'-phosphate oxidase superfamily)